VHATGVIAVATGLALAGLVGCGGGARPAASPLSSDQRLNLGVVAIDARIGGERVRSSGVVLDAARGTVLTSAHTVWGARSLRVTTGLGVLYGRIVARAACSDLALVETQPRLPGLVALERADGPPPAAALLTAVGRRRADPDAGPSSLLTIPTRAAPAARGAPRHPALGRPHEVIRLDGSLVPESSGGPVLDSDGRLVAIALATASRTALAVPWPAIQSRLDELQRDERRVNAGWRYQYRCARRMHALARAEHPRYRPADARINAPVPATRVPGTEFLDAE